MMVSLIVAVSENGVIGKDNQLPWRLPADLKFFKKNTLGKPIIMGRKTCESLGRVLPYRRNIVISRDPDYHAEGFEHYTSLDAALHSCRQDPEVFIIGGGNLYKQAMEQQRVEKLYLTIVHGNFEGDTFFEIPREGWNEVYSKHNEPDENNAWPYTFKMLEKKR